MQGKVGGDGGASRGRRGGGTLSASDVTKGRTGPCATSNKFVAWLYRFFYEQTGTCLLLVNALIESAPARSADVVAFPSAEGDALFADNCAKTTSSRGISPLRAQWSSR